MLNDWTATKCLRAPSLQSRRNFVELVLCIFLTETMAAIFDFSGSGRLGRGAVNGQK